MAQSRITDYTKLVELPVRKKLLSLLAGRHGGERAGSSHEFLDMAEYKVGDDISDIDWKSTARHNQPIIKRFESTAVMNVFLVVDGGANMAALSSGGQGILKKDVADEFCTAIAWLTAARGDLLGLVVGNQRQLRSVPARSGLSHSETILRVAGMAVPDGPAADLPRLLRRLESGARSRSLVLIVTDREQINRSLWRTLRRLQTRQRVMVLLTEDYDPTQAAEGDQLADVNAGPIPDFVKDNPTIGYQWSRVVEQQRRQAEELLRALRIPFAAAGSREDVLGALLALTERGDHGVISA